VTDQAFSALLDDLESRGLLDETLIVWGGRDGTDATGRTECGRRSGARGVMTRSLAACLTTVLAGGGVKGGLVYGSSESLCSGAGEPADLAGRPGGHYLSLSGRRSEHAVTDRLNRPSTLLRGHTDSALLS